MPDSMLQIENLNKAFGGLVAINDLSMKVTEGEIHAIIGPNGAGKTTLIRIVNQITMPDTGKVLMDRIPLSRQHITKIGYLPEERGLYKKMKVGEQALYLAKLKGMSNNEAIEKLKSYFF